MDGDLKQHRRAAPEQGHERRVATRRITLWGAK